MDDPENTDRPTADTAGSAGSAGITGAARTARAAHATRIAPRLEDVASPLWLLGIAAGLFAANQLLLAAVWVWRSDWLALLVASLAAVVLPVGILCRRRQLPVGRALRLHWPAPREAVGALLVACGALGPVYLASRLLEPWVEAPGELADLYAAFVPSTVLAFLGGFFAIAVVAPLAEEVIFRGLVLRALARIAGMPAAAAGSAVLFGAVHGSLWLAIPVGLLGVVLAAVTWRTQRLTAAWIVHAVFNAVAYFELCATRDAGSDVVARVASRPAIATGLAGVLCCGWWLLPRRTSIESAPPGSETGGDAADPWTSDAAGGADHL